MESVSEIDEDTFTAIMVMYSDGILGNRGIINTLGALTNGVFNYIRAPNTAPYNLKQIIGNVYGYLYPDAEVDPSDALKGFISQAKGFDFNKFKRG